MICVLCLSNQNAKPQDSSKVSIKFSSGYFMDVFFANAGWDNPNFNKIHQGEFLMFEMYGKTKKNLFVGLKMGKCTTRRPYSDPGGLFWENEQRAVYSIYGITLKKEFINNKHTLGISGGPIYRNLNSTRIEYLDVATFSRENSSGVIETYNGIINPEIKEVNEHDLGINVNLEYCYNVYKYLHVGLNIESYFLMYYGLEGVMAGPVIKASF